MPSRFSVTRLLRFLALLVQVTLPVAGGLADAHLEVEALDSRVHVESTSHDCDERGHPELCAICHFLRTTPAPTGTAVAAIERERAEAAATTDVVLQGLRRQTQTLPRGPPAFG